MMLNFGYRQVKGFRGMNWTFNRTIAVFLAIQDGQMTKIDRAKK